MFRLAGRPGSTQRALFALTISIVLLVSGHGLVAQQPRVQADETFTDEVTVLEIEVPVQVFRDGRPVRGLERDDFTITYRGDRQEIVGFEVADVSIESTRTAAAPSVVAPAPSESASRAVLMLFDFQYSRRDQIDRGVDAVREMLPQLHPSDRLAVAMMGGRRGAQLVTGFTTDRERTELGLELIDAIADAKKKRRLDAIAGLQATAPTTDRGLADEYGAAATVAFGDGLADVTVVATPAVDVDAAIGFASAADVALGPDSGTLGSVTGGAADALAIGNRLARFDGFRQLSYYADALGNLGTLLSGVTGQKYVLLFSQGPPMNLLEMETVSSDPDVPGDPAEGTARALDSLRDAFGQLVRAGWHIHALSQGIRPAAMAGSFGSIDQISSAGPRIDAVSVAGRRDGGGGVFFMADETGGKAYLNAALPPVEEFLDQTSVTYVLRFLLPGVPVGAGKEPIRVEVSASDVELSYRDFFYAPKADRDMNEVEMRIADARDTIRDQAERAARALEFTAHAFVDPDRMDRVWLTVHLAASQLQRSHQAILDQGGDASRARLNVLAGLELGGPAGRVFLDQKLELDGQSLSAPPTDGLTFTGIVDFDEVASEASQVRVAVELGPAGARMTLPLQRWIPVSPEQPSLVGPFFMPPGLERLIVRGKDDVGNPVTLPLRAPGGAELVPLPFAEVVSGEEVGVLLWSHEQGSTGLGDSVPITVSMHAAEGRTQQPPLQLDLQRRGTVEWATLWFAPLDTEVLQPGVYRLESSVDPAVRGFFRVGS